MVFCFSLPIHVMEFYFIWKWIWSEFGGDLFYKYRVWGFIWASQNKLYRYVVGLTPDFFKGENLLVHLADLECETSLLVVVGSCECMVRFLWTLFCLVADFWATSSSEGGVFWCSVWFSKEVESTCRLYLPYWPFFLVCLLFGAFGVFVWAIGGVSSVFACFLGIVRVSNVVVASFERSSLCLLWFVVAVVKWQQAVFCNGRLV